MYKSILLKPQGAWKIALLLLPIIEIIIFVVVAKAIGVLLTLALVIASSVWGARVLKHNTQRKQVESQQASQALLIEQTLDTTVVMTAGILLIVPGFITSLIGALGLIPAVRQFFIKMIWRKRPVTAAPSATEGSVIEGEYWRHDDKDAHK